MKEPKKSSKRLKFPVLNNVEYVSIYRAGMSVLEIDGNEIEGKTWREFQLYLGEKIPIGKAQFTLKFKDSAELHTGAVRAARVGGNYQPNPKEDDKMSEKIIKEFSNLKEAITKATNTGGVSFDMLLASTKQGYEAQATYLNQKITDLNATITELKQDIRQLENDLDDCEKESAKSTGIAQYLQMGEKIVSIYLGNKTKTPVSLKESNTSDIPDQILQVLGIINWSLIDAESINRIANQIHQYLSVLPEKYFKGAQQ